MTDEVKEGSKFTTFQKRILIALVAIMALLLVVALLFLIFFPSAFTRNARSPVPITRSATVTPGSVVQLRQAFGPWSIVPDAANATPHIVMLMNSGTVEQGTRSLRPDKSWQVSVVNEFTDIIPFHSTIKVRTTSGATYRLAIGQTFVLESHPETVYAFMDNSTIVAAPAASFYAKGK